MKPAVVLCCIFAAGPALAQVPPDAVDKLRACSALAGIGRVECLDRLASDIGPPPLSQQEAVPEPPLLTEWVVSETMSPLDYSPVAIASSELNANDGAGLQFSIRCRGGRSELVLSSSTGFARRPEDYLASYSTNGGTPVAVPLAPATTGPGLALKAEPVRFLGSLPREGRLAIRVVFPNGLTVEGRYGLEQLKAVTARLAAPCNWPQGSRSGPTLNSSDSKLQRRP